MKKWLLILVGVCLIPILVQAKHHAAKETHNWPHLRGPNANGLVDKGNPPVEWSEDTNIRWKVKIPGTGHATPIIWGDKIFVQTAVKTDKTVDVAQNARKPLPTHIYNFMLLALDRKSGDVVWEKTVREALPHEGTHKTANYAGTSGVTDGEHLYAFYGSWGLYCYDFDGNLKWDKDLGDMRVAGSFGEGSSPTIHGNTLIINWDHQGASFIVALDKRTGEEIWRTARPERTTWTTPIVVEHKGTQQIIVGASKKTRSYDLKTGDVLWECAGLGSNVIPTALYADGIVYVTSGHRDPAMQAISLDKAKGDITGTDAVLWTVTGNFTPYVSSPLLSGDNIYSMRKTTNILFCFNAKTGEKVFGPERLQGLNRIYSPLVGTGDRIYLAGLAGMTYVIKDGSEFEVLAKNKLDEGTGASPVIAGDELYLRGSEHLYCIAAN